MIKFTKISLALAAVAFSLSTFADTGAATATPNYSGIYGDLQVGWVAPHDNIQPYGDSSFGLAAIILTAVSVGAKLSVGYQFNQNYAVQIGYFNAQQLTTSIQTDPGFRSSLYYYDLAFKGMYPVSQHFNLNGLLGLAYAQQKVWGGTSAFDPPNGSENAVLPEVGAGIAYNFTPKFNMSLSVLYIAPSNNGISSTFFVPLGISYRF